MITDAYDLLAPLSVHLNWSSPSHTLLIFQGLILATISLFFIAPFLPYRFILLVAGEGAFIINHPWTQPVVTKLLDRIGEGKEGRRLKAANRMALAQISEWIKMDQLPDDVWTRGWREVEVFENERYVTSSPGRRASSISKSEWSGHNLRYGERKVGSIVVARLYVTRELTPAFQSAPAMDQRLGRVCRRCLARGRIHIGREVSSDCAQMANITSC